jgi:hypothetical protein
MIVARMKEGGANARNGRGLTRSAPVTHGNASRQGIFLYLHGLCPTFLSTEFKTGSIRDQIHAYYRAGEQFPYCKRQQGASYI